MQIGYFLARLTIFVVSENNGLNGITCLLKLAVYSQEKLLGNKNSFWFYTKLVPLFLF